MSSLKKLIPYMKPYRLWALLAPVFMILEVTMDLAQPRLLQSIVDIGIARHDVGFVVHTGIIMLVVALMGLAGGVGCGIFATMASLHFSTAIRDSAFRKVQDLSFANLDRLETGSLVTRLTSDVDQVQDASLMILRGLIRSPLLAVGGLIMALMTAPRLSLILLIIGPILVYMVILVTHKAHPLFTAVQERMDRLNNVMQENLAGVRVVKAFVRARFESSRFGAANDDLSSSKVRALSVVAAVMPGLTLLMNLGVVAVIWFGGVSVVQGGLRVGQLLAFVNYLLQMLASLMMVSMALMFMSRADASAERIVEVLESEPDVVDSPQAMAMNEGRGRVEFDGVSFRYDDGDMVLEDVSFVAEPGSTIGILGATGEGKSTLVSLIPRLYDVTAGRVLVDGVDVRSVTQESLRRRIAVVLQKSILFMGTIRDNLRFGRLDATDEEIEDAARMAQAHDFIMGFPHGYDTDLSQGGVNLSGGQKQRLAIARALVARPDILILDDCTSAVDMTTEARILESLDSWDRSCTRFIIAQRISAVTEADRILVIENGRIAADGTHDDLLTSSPVYRGIVESQIGAREAVNG